VGLGAAAGADAASHGGHCWRSAARADIYIAPVSDCVRVLQLALYSCTAGLGSR
jgi:hypothetical protein